MWENAEFTCLGCGKISRPELRYAFMTEIECFDCHQEKGKAMAQAQIQIHDIAIALGAVIESATHDARDKLRAALEIYSHEYPTAYQFIHADNPFLSQLLCVMAAETHANITRPDDAA